ncbi:MAG TPA: glutamine-hydrolyzing GMP synthase, partial [Acidimicrobiales bacterium]|nr:glutamine-hydrolyzing GMP synthase [Acidimicrobiales bacterium]
MPERVLILDFGSQYTQLIARRVREHRVYCEIHPCTVDDLFVTSFAPAAIILSGGPASTHEASSPRAPAAVFELGVPVLGVCYGEQAICAQLGGRVEPSSHREYGRAEIRLERPSPLFEGILDPGQTSTVWMSHGDRGAAIPKGFAAIAKSDTSPFAAIADDARRFYGLQFHPEVVHTAIGPGLLQNFLFRIAGLRGDWSMHAYREHATQRIRDQVGQGGVICGLSGGVDSAVAALLIHEAVGDQLTCVFVDTGLLRFGEAREVVDLFRGHFNIPLVHVEAGERFLAALAGQSDPEAKRKIIGSTFIDVFEEEAT